jgi:acyl-CoA synthetase (AMP-forming)/AMP-acid ligase II
LLQRFSPGDRVVVWAPNVPEWIVLQYGAALAGLVLVTANPALRAGELRYVLEQSRAAGLFHAHAFRGTDMSALAAEASRGLPELRERVELTRWPDLAREAAGLTGELPFVDPGDPAQIQYTSGTTGFPKGALLHHRGLVTNARYVGLRAGFQPGETYISAMPLFHTAGCAMGVLGSAHVRATYVLLQLFDPGLMLEAIGRFRPDSLLGVPTMHIALLDHPGFADVDVSSIRIAMSGGSSVPPSLVARVEAAYGCGFTTVFGQTELSPVVTQTSPADSTADKADTVGRPLWNVEVKVVDTRTGEVAPVGEQGEVCARGYQQMLEYFDQPERTAETVDADGWLHTGDLGTMDDRGYMAITGRLKDMIIRGGENVYPAEIEQLLFTHPQVAEVAVVGQPDPEWGEVVAAAVRPRNPGDLPTVADLRALCRGSLAPHKTPAAWYVADALPLTGSGKVQKFRVQELIADGAYPRLA